MTANKTAKDDPVPSSMGAGCPKFSRRRLVPLAVVALVSGVVIGMGWHRQLSFETLVRHHEALRDFIATHEASAVAGYVTLYIGAVALSIPVGFFLTMIGGILFGAVLGGMAALFGATIGAILIFLIAKSAIGEQLVRRAGSLAQKLALGFRADAFSYLLFLRLVPIFPFWLVNLVSALCGVRLATFAGATALGIIPMTFAIAFVGASTDASSRQQAAYRSCPAAGHSDCFTFHMNAAVTPEFLAALAALRGSRPDPGREALAEQNGRPRTDDRR
jgi:uncharacterized membrane protein YdjX (TVP38/TMEM64 family)